MDSAGALCSTPIRPDQSLASLAPGASLADGLTHGGIESRLDHYLNINAFTPAPEIGADGCTVYGNLRRNIYRRQDVIPQPDLISSSSITSLRHLPVRYCSTSSLIEMGDNCAVSDVKKEDFGSQSWP